MSTYDLDEETMTGLHALLNRPEAGPGPSPHALRRLAAGDLPDAEARAVREAVQADPALAERLAAEEAMDRAFLAQHPFSAVRERLLEAAGEAPDPAPHGGLFGPFLRPRSLLWAIAAAVTALLLAVLVPDVVQGPEPVTSPQGANRLKGDALTAWQDAGGAAVRLDHGAVLREGDVVQFTVSSMRSHLALLGVDGTGTVSRYVPVGGELSMRREAGAGPLRDALVLDAAPGPEVFVAFLTDEALLVEDLERAVHDAVDATGVRGLPDVDWVSLGIDADIGLFLAEKAEDAPR